MLNTEQIWKSHLEELLELAGKGDQDALKALYTHYSGPAEEYARVYISDIVEAKDAAEEALQRVFGSGTGLPSAETLEACLKQAVEEEAHAGKAEKKSVGILLYIIPILVICIGFFAWKNHLIPGLSDNNNRESAAVASSQPEASPEPTVSASQEPAEPSPSPEPAVTEVPETRRVIWTEEPGMAADELRLMEGPTLNLHEYSGYPMDWEDHAQQMSLDNSLIAYRWGKTLKITSFDRQNTLLTLNVGEDDGLPFFEEALDSYIIWAKSTDYPYVAWFFSPDFTSARKLAFDSSKGYYVSNSYNSETNQLVYSETGEPAQAPEGTHTYSEQYDESGRRLYVADNYGNVIYYKDSDYYADTFVNGYYVTRNMRNYYIGDRVPNPDLRCQLNRIDTGEPITDMIYERTMYFEDGYCPVKKNGKWGFINEKGEEVTDFIWDNVSVLYHGQTYVGINGIYGILNLKETLSQGIPVTLNTVYGGEAGVPQALPAEERGGAIGELMVLVSDLEMKPTIETYGSYNPNSLGTLNQWGKYAVYEVAYDQYAEKTWYRIGEDCWVPDMYGQWVEYTEY